MSVPPSYSQATGQHAADGLGLSYVDFIPACTDEGGLFSNPTFEPFGVLIEKANNWLRTVAHGWEAKTCESIEFKTHYMQVETEKMTFSEYGKRRTYYVRCLRLWMVPRTDPNRPSQQLRYINFVPLEGSYGEYKFEPSNQFLERINTQLRAHSLPGRILTIETQEMKQSLYGPIDPDRSFWSEHGNQEIRFVKIIRIFYEVGDFQHEQIGFADFVPPDPKVTTASDLVVQAQRWTQQQRNIRFTNSQCLEFKMKYGDHIDLQRTYHTQHRTARIRFARILRVSYVSSNTGSEHVPLILTCKLFVPVCISAGGFVSRAQYENMSATLNRISMWMKLSGARLLSAETNAHKMLSGYMNMRGPDSCYTFNYGKSAVDTYVYVIRLYFDGSFTEPPAGELPPVPTLQQSDDCCNVM